MESLDHRPLEPGMGVAVARRTILREGEDWGAVATRVAQGNTSLLGETHDFAELRDHIAQARLLMSGRHLQHGDYDQEHRPQEVFTNCSTSAFAFANFYLLLNGSGVGRSYDDDLMVVDWRNMPQLLLALSPDHPDYTPGAGWADPEEECDVYFKVPDTREGWAKAVELLEQMAFAGNSQDAVALIDFSDVRPEGTPIMGMQGRPASGPVAVMEAMQEAFSFPDDAEPWRQAMIIDHHLAACVSLGGSRRAARMATKWYKDEGIFDFIRIKDEGGLWSSNNSVAVDDAFWENAAIEGTREREIFDAIMESQFTKGTGEPGFITVSSLLQNDEGMEVYQQGPSMGSDRYQPEESTRLLIKAVHTRALQKEYPMIVNPCVTGDTWVQTSEGPRQVIDLLDKPFTAVVDGKEYPATGFWKTGTKDVLKLTLESGQEVRLTANHRILVERNRRQKFGGGYNVDQEWVEAGDLQVGDRIVLHNHRGLDWRGEGTFSEGWLVGEIAGDGGHNPDKYQSYVRFWGDDRGADARKAEDAIRSLDFPLRADFSGGTDNGTATTLKTASLTKLAGKYLAPASKSPLAALEETSAEFHAGFLSGMFDADGCPQGTAGKGISVRLAQSGDHGLERLRTAQRMLARLGVQSRIYQDRRPAGTRTFADGVREVEAQHELIISRDNIPVFADRVGFQNEAKQERLMELVASVTLRGLYGERFSSPVASIEADGTEDVYDCTVDEVHAFDANGMVVHNCGEIPLFVLGGYCVIGDWVPFFADTLEEAQEAAKAMTRALIRTNQMDCFYHAEVARTNRIGVGITGIQEFAWKFFGLTFRDLIADADILLGCPCLTGGACTCDEDLRPYYGVEAREAQLEALQSWPFWQFLMQTRLIVEAEADRYSDHLWLNRPHTVTTIKPAGTTSKLHALTEGAHLPAMREYLRWVQFKKGSDQVNEHREEGYPVKEVPDFYPNVELVGFPTQPKICQLGIPEEKIVTADEATMEEQYLWVRLLEKFWLGPRGNQVSYTLKYRTEDMTVEEFSATVLENQPKVRCISVMPADDWRVTVEKYGYVPEQPLEPGQYEAIVNAITSISQNEDIDIETLYCEGGACPI